MNNLAKASRKNLPNHSAVTVIEDACVYMLQGMEQSQYKNNDDNASNNNNNNPSMMKNDE